MAMSATIHLWISASNESTAKLSLGKKQGHLFAGSREPGAGSREPGLTLSPSYTRPLQNSKAATLGVKPTHLLCISVEGVAGPTTTTPPSLHHHLIRCQAHPPPLYLCRGGGRVHHHHSTFPPPPLHAPLHPPHFLHLPSPWTVTSDIHHQQLQSKRRLQQIRDMNSLSSVVLLEMCMEGHTVSAAGCRLDC